MALIEVKITDKMEILEDGSIQVRVANRVIREETGETVAQTFHRHVITPDQEPHEDDCARCKAVCAAVHTPECKAAYAAKQAAARANGNAPV